MDKSRIKSEREKQIDSVAEKFKVNVITPMLDTAKEQFGSELSPSSKKALERKIAYDSRREIGKIIHNFDIEQKELDYQKDRDLDKVSTEKEKQSVLEKYEKKKIEVQSDLQSKITDKISDLEENAGIEIVNRVVEDRENKKAKVVEEKIRDHLRGFSRTIPSFLMAYGGPHEITLANFDSIIPEDVFEEVTSITVKDFRILRDGGEVINEETGEPEYFEGNIFDETVFNDSVKEFLRLKNELADYFDEDSKEDIFDYIPPQKTNQIFTPRKVVIDMVNKLEQENPGCFDDDTKTFADLYMKSGLYLTEIVKRLYRSKRMKMLFPDDNERLNHIFSKQIYGLAPTEIIYRIVIAYVLGFKDEIEIKSHNIRQFDSLECAKMGKLKDILESIFKKSAPEFKYPEPHDTVERKPRQNNVEPGSVMHRVKSVKQPFGGYINPKSMTCIPFNDGKTLGKENIHPITVGLVVDYLTRLNQGATVDDAFRISMLGALRVNRTDELSGILSKISGLDDNSIINASKAVFYDQFYRAGFSLEDEPEYKIPDAETCENIRVMVLRAMTFFSKFGPVVKDGPTFPGGYSKVITTGDGDFTTKDTLWDFKVSKNPPTKDNTLQLAIYYLMSKKSTIKEYGSLTKIGIFNPRLNMAFVLKMNLVPKETILAIEKDVICY